MHSPGARIGALCRRTVRVQLPETVRNDTVPREPHPTAASAKDDAATASTVSSGNADRWRRWAASAKDDAATAWLSPGRHLPTCGAAGLLAIAVGLLVVAAASRVDGDQAAKKGTLSAEALWSGAALIVGGTIHGLRPTGTGYLEGRIEPAVVFQGNAQEGEIRVRIYGSSESEGRSAIWLFRGSPDGVFEESYPWMRAGPKTFMAWPGTVREKVLARLPHARSHVVGGWQLFVIQVPTGRGDPLAAWAAIRGPGDDCPFRVAATTLSATVAITRPDGSISRSSLAVHPKPSCTSTTGSVFIFEQRGATPTDQIVVDSLPSPGRYRISVEAMLPPSSKNRVAATLVLADARSH